MFWRVKDDCLAICASSPFFSVFATPRRLGPLSCNYCLGKWLFFPLVFPLSSWIYGHIKLPELKQINNSQNKVCNLYFKQWRDMNLYNTFWSATTEYEANVLKLAFKECLQGKIMVEYRKQICLDQNISSSHLSNKYFNQFPWVVVQTVPHFWHPINFGRRNYNKNMKLTCYL